MPWDSDFDAAFEEVMVNGGEMGAVCQLLKEHKDEHNDQFDAKPVPPGSGGGGVSANHCSGDLCIGQARPAEADGR